MFKQSRITAWRRALLVFGWTMAIMAGLRVYGQTGLDHFSWEPIASPQMVETPFPVRIQARDPGGHLIPDFNGTVNLSGRAPASLPPLLISEVEVLRGVELFNPTSVPQDVSGWRIIFYDSTSWPELSTTAVVPDGVVCPPGQVFQFLFSYETTSRFPIFYNFISPRWTANPFYNQIAVRLLNPQRETVDFFCAVDAYADQITDPAPVPPEMWDGQPLPLPVAAPATYQRTGHYARHDPSGWSIVASSLGKPNPGLQMPLIAGYRAIASSPGSITFTNGTWAGTVTVKEPVAGLILNVDDGSSHTGETGSFSVEPLPQLAVHFPPRASEANPGLVGQGVVQLPGPLETNLEVFLAASDLGEIAIPAKLTIPAGQTNAAFAVTNLDDAKLDGSQTVTVTVTAPGYSTGSAQIVNDDNETSALSVSFRIAGADVSAGVLADWGEVTTGAPVDKAVVVELHSSNTNRVQVPSQTVISAGGVSAPFDLKLINRFLISENEKVTITASVTGWATGSADLTVGSYLARHIFLSLSMPLLEGGGVFPGGGGVAINGITLTNLVIYLNSDNTNKLVVPSQVTIPAGQSSVNFDVALPDNHETDGAKTVAFSASAPGFDDIAVSLGILDDDIHHFAFSCLPAAIGVGTNVGLAISAVDTNGAIIPNFNRTLPLRATNVTGGVGLSLDSITFTNGAWSGAVTVNARESRGTVLLVDDGNGHNGASAGFDVGDGQVFNLPVSDIVYDQARGTLLAGLLGTAGTNGQSVVSVDPDTGTISAPIFLGSDPGGLALTDDGKWLYVALASTGGIVRVNLETRSIDSRFDLAPPGVAMATFAEAFLPMPGTPDSLLVSFRRSGDSGVAVFDEGIQRPDVVATTAFFSPLVSYGSGGKFYQTYRDHVRRLQVTPTGVKLIEERQGGWGDFGYGGGLLYSTTGAIYEPERFRLVAQLPAGGNVCPDSSRARVYYLNAGLIQAFDAQSFVKTGELTVPGIVPAFVANRLIACGDNRLAFCANGLYLVLVHTDLAPSLADSDLTMAVDSLPNPVKVGSTYTFTVAVTNSGPATVTKAVLVDQLPPELKFVSASTPAGPGYETNGIVTCTLGVLTNGGFATVSLTAQVMAPGVLTNVIRALGGRSESARNAAVQPVTAIFDPILPAITTLHLYADRLAYSATANRLYATTERLDGADKVGLQPVNMNTGLLDPFVPLDTVSGALAVSGDGRYVYAVASGPGSGIYRVDASTGMLVSTLGSPVGLPTELRSAPSQPDTLAAVGNGMAVYENGGLSEYGLSGTALFAAEFSSTNASRVYATAAPTFGVPAFYRIAADARMVTLRDLYTGLLSIWADPGSGSTFPPYLRQGVKYMFSSAGDVVDPEQPKRIKTMPENGFVWPDAATGKVYFLAPYFTRWALAAYDQSTLALAWRMVIPGVSGTPGRLEGCGPGLLAFPTTEGQIFVINTAALHPPLANLAVTSSISTNSALSGTTVTFTTIVSNQGPARATGVVLTNTLPYESLVAPVKQALISSYSSSQGTTTFNGVLMADLGNLDPGASAMLTFTGSLPPGLSLSTAGVVLNEFDPNLSDNGATLSSLATYLSLPGVTQFLVPAADVAYDPVRKILYASLGGGVPGGNGVLAIDPATEMAGAQLNLDYPAGRLALSDDGQFLYAAAADNSFVWRLRSQTLAVDSSFGLGDQLAVEDMAVQPGNPKVIAVARRKPDANPDHDSLVIYENGVPRAQSTAPPVYADSLAFGDSPATLYAYGRETNDFLLHTLQVDASGVELQNSAGGLVSGAGTTIKFAGGLIYTSTGAVIDPQTSKIIGQFVGPGLGTAASSTFPPVMAPDPDHQRVFFLTTDGATANLYAYDTGSYALIAGLTIPYVYGAPVRLVVCGDAGVAFCTTYGQVFFCEADKLIGADIEVTQSASPGQPTTGDEISFTISVKNRGPGDASHVAIVDTLPAYFILDDVSISTGFTNQPFDGGWDLGGLTNGATETLTFTGRVTAPGVYDNSARVFFNDVFDPVSTNNQTAFRWAVTPSNGPIVTNLLYVPWYSDFTYNPGQKKVLVAATNGVNEILRFDPATLLWEASLQVPGTIAKMIASADGQSLYVESGDTNVVGRIDPASGKRENSFALGRDPINYPWLIADWAVAPNDSLELAMAEQSGVGYGFVGVYDDGVMRLNTIPGLFNSLAFSADGTKLFGVHARGVQAMAVSPDGLQVIAERQDITSPQLVFADGMVFLATGEVLNPDTLATIRTLPVNGFLSADPARHRVYYVTSWNPPLYDPVKVHAFDTFSGAEVWDRSLFGASIPVSKIMALGEGHIVVSTGGALFVLDTSSVESNHVANLTVAQASLPAALTVGDARTITITVANNGPWTATGVLFTNVLSSGLAVTSATSSTGTIVQTNSSLVVCDLGNLLSGSSATITLTVNPSQEGTQTSFVSVSGNEPDPNPGDNTLMQSTVVSPIPELSILDVMAREGNHTYTFMTLAAQLSAPSSHAITARFTFQDGTATRGADYNFYSGGSSFYFPPGATNSMTASVLISDDNLVEPPETFFVNLTNVVGAVIGRGRATCTIIDTDTYSLSVTNAIPAGGNSGIASAIFPVTLSAPSDAPVAVQYWTADGTARAGQNYTAKAGALNFPPGVTNQIISVPVLGNPSGEGPKTFLLLLANPDGAGLVSAEATGTILADDPAMLFSIDRVFWTDTDLHLSLRVHGGHTYRLERSEDLGTGEWVAVGENLAGQEQILEVVDANAASRSQGFYRVRQLP